MSNTILAQDIITEVQQDFIESPPTNLIKAKINAIIHHINAVIGKKREIIEIYSGTAGTFEDLDATFDDLDSVFTDIDGWINDFEYDSDDYKLTVPKTIDKLEVLWIDDDRYEARNYETVVTDTTNAKIYCFIGNDIYFSSDISADGDKIKVQVIMNFPDINDEGYVSLPYDYRTMLVSGAISMIAITQKHRDADLFKVHRRIYDGQARIMLAQKNTADSPDVINYGSVDDLINYFNTDDYYKEYKL